MKMTDFWAQAAKDIIASDEVLGKDAVLDKDILNIGDSIISDDTIARNDGPIGLGFHESSNAGFEEFTMVLNKTFFDSSPIELYIKRLGRDSTPYLYFRNRNNQIDIPNNFTQWDVLFRQGNMSLYPILGQ